jgi:hypothetical protein
VRLSMTHLIINRQSKHGFYALLCSRFARDENLNKMEVSVKFTKEELKLIYDALTLGYIHGNNEAQGNKMQELSHKIQMLGALAKQNGA